ncbi:hypothetical protein GQ600_12206 [Phytophthora cactorum]|nr:hypothetical protein GQ600_12206 [Phytophthora cactorum]
MPMQIRHALGRKFGIRCTSQPAHGAKRRAPLSANAPRGNDKRKAIMEAVRASAFSGREGDHDAFTFTIAKLRERSRGLSSELSALVYKGVYDLQFARSEAEFVEQKEAMLKEWAGHADLTAFTAYVKPSGNFANWQSFLTPPGYATTNNPVEQFNRALKRDYTHHRQLKMGLLLAQLLACCGHRSMALPRFSLAPTCPSTLQTRTRGLRRRGLLSENVLTRSSIDFLLGDADPDSSTCVRCLRCGRLSPSSTARERTWRLPPSSVFTTRAWRWRASRVLAGRSTFALHIVLANTTSKWGYCCHLLFAQQSKRGG